MNVDPDNHVQALDPVQKACEEYVELARAKRRGERPGEYISNAMFRIAEAALDKWIDPAVWKELTELFGKRREVSK